MVNQRACILCPLDSAGSMGISGVSSRELEFVRPLAD